MLKLPLLTRSRRYYYAISTFSLPLEQRTSACLANEPASPFFTACVEAIYTNPYDDKANVNNHRSLVASVCLAKHPQGKFLNEEIQHPSRPYNTFACLFTLNLIKILATRLKKNKDIQ